MNELYQRLTSAISEQERNFIHIYHTLEKLFPYLPIEAEDMEDKDLVNNSFPAVDRGKKTLVGLWCFYGYYFDKTPR